MEFYNPPSGLVQLSFYLLQGCSTVCGIQYETSNMVIGVINHINSLVLSSQLCKKEVWTNVLCIKGYLLLVRLVVCDKQDHEHYHGCLLFWRKTGIYVHLRYHWITHGTDYCIRFVAQFIQLQDREKTLGLEDKRLFVEGILVYLHVSPATW